MNDEGDVVGLEQDYASLGADKDKFELHLHNLLNKQIGKTFVSGSIKTPFPMVSGTEVCHVEIAAANDPVFLNVADKSGQKLEKLYVRSGCSSQEFSLSDFNEYRKERFS